jgi:hypothetical protein
MKISEIKSKEVRNEAVRLAIEANDLSFVFFFRYLARKKALKMELSDAFYWVHSPQGLYFWAKLKQGRTPNTLDLKLPKKNPSE